MRHRPIIPSSCAWPGRGCAWAKPSRCNGEILTGLDGLSRSGVTTLSGRSPVRRTAKTGGWRVVAAINGGVPASVDTAQRGDHTAWLASDTLVGVLLVSREAPRPSLCPLASLLSRLAKAGLRHVWIHDLGYTYASLLLQQGESLAYIRDQLGHRSIQVTVDIYGHLVSRCNKAVVDRLDDAPICNLPVTARQSHKVCCCLCS